MVNLCYILNISTFLLISNALNIKHLNNLPNSNSQIALYNEGFETRNINVPSFKFQKREYQDVDQEFESLNVNNVLASTVYRAGTDELKNSVHDYVQIGKEKWAGFLATSNCNKFQKLLDKIKKQLLDFQNHSSQEEDNDADCFEKFTIILDDVIDYWETEDAATILNNTKGLSYEEFGLDSVSSHSNNNQNVNNNDDQIDQPSDEYTLNHHQDLLETLNPNSIQTTKQKQWLKENALRRANIIKSLLSGDLNENILKQDTVSYRDSDIFLPDDDNEFKSNAFKIQSTNLAIYIFFLVEIFFFN